MAERESNDPTDSAPKRPLGGRIKAAFRRPITYVALLAVAVGIVALVLSLTRDYGETLPTYALELPFLLHLMHSGAVILIVAAVGGLLVRLLRGDEPDQVGAGPLSLGVGRSSRKAIRELRDAVAVLRDRQERLENEVSAGGANAAELKGLPETAEGEGERDAGSQRESSGPMGGKE